MKPIFLVVSSAFVVGLLACGGRIEGEVADAGNADASTPVALAPRRIAAGFEHTCMVLADQTVACFGLNANGQLGDGTTHERSTPTKVVGLDSVVEIAAGYLQTCARRSDGHILCWGDDLDGASGGGGRDVCGGYPCSTTPIELAGVSSATQISLGHGHGCARLSDGTVECWGTDTFGQIGDGVIRNGGGAPPTVVAGLSSVVQIALGGARSCALLADGTVRCWGYGLAAAASGGDGSPQLTPTTVAGISSAVEIAVEETYACARLADASVRCWGYGFEGELGDGSSHGSSPVAVVGATDVTRIAVGGEHTCARLADASATCWGSNSSGELGDGTHWTRYMPVPVSALAGVEELALGKMHTCARLSDDTVRCWGNNEHGQLGDGTTTGRDLPTAVR